MGGFPSRLGAYLCSFHFSYSDVTGSVQEMNNCYPFMIIAFLRITSLAAGSDTPT